MDSREERTNHPLSGLQRPKGRKHPITCFAIKLCQINGIVYSQFKKWYRRRGKMLSEQEVSPIEVINVPIDGVSHFGSIAEVPKIVSLFTITFYFVRCLSRLFAQTFDSKDYDWKAIVKVY